MKKILSLVLALCMVFAVCSLVGCGKDEVDESGNSASQTESTASTDSKVEVTTVNNGKLTMGTNAYFAPYEYYDGEKIVGIDAEIAEAIAKKLGLTLEIKDMQFDSIITAVEAGDVDVGIAGMTVTDERKEQVDFSISYANGVQSIIVKEDSAIKIADYLFADGANYKVGVQLGTTGDIYCEDDLGKERVTEYANGNEAVVALLGGDIDCVVIDNEPAKSFVANNQGLKILETAYADEDYAIAIKKGNTQLRDAIDDAIKALTSDGTIDAILKKYIK